MKNNNDKSSEEKDISTETSSLECDIRATNVTTYSKPNNSSAIQLDDIEDQNI